jgi:hypothetical protein
MRFMIGSFSPVCEREKPDTRRGHCWNGGRYPLAIPAMPLLVSLSARVPGSNLKFQAYRDRMQEWFNSPQSVKDNQFKKL